MEIYIIDDESLKLTIKNTMDYNKISVDDDLVILTIENDLINIFLTDIMNQNIIQLTNSVNTKNNEFQFGRKIRDIFGNIKGEYSVKITEDKKCQFIENPTIEKRSGFSKNVVLRKIKKDTKNSNYESKKIKEKTMKKGQM